jgi:pyruvate,water dikinase
MNFIRYPSESASVSDYGGKAYALSELNRAGLPIPEWFVVTPSGFHQSLNNEQKESFDLISEIEEIKTLVYSVVPIEELREEIKEAVGKLARDGSLLAVRSSASDEDSAEHSFAGQFDSFLYVGIDEVIEKVIAVWKSGFSERILTYRKENNLLIVPNPPAVLVQKMIDPDYSGVAFGADPVSGRRNIAVVGAVYGPGTAIVSGDCDADTFHVDIEGKIVLREIASKKYRHAADGKGHEGVSRVEVEEELQGVQSISDEQVKEVAKLVRRTGEYIGKPQDIEWAISKGNLYLLQSRPITTLHKISDPDGDLNIWDNHNIAESYSGVTTPLTFSFARSAYEAVYREFCRILKVPESKIRANDETFKNMLGLIRGRVYYNLLNWYRMLALLPGFQVNRKFMEQMMGVEESLPDEIAMELHSATFLQRFVDSLNLIHSIFGIINNQVRIKSIIKEFYHRLDDALADTEIPLQKMNPKNLAEYYRLLEGKLLRKWDAPLINDFLAMIFYGVLKKLVEKWCGDEDGTLQNNLLCGQGGMISAEPAQRVREMAEMVSEDEELVEYMRNEKSDVILRRFENYPEIRNRYLEYIDKFGDRCMEELKLESSTLHDDPSMLLKSIGEYAKKIRIEIEKSGKYEHRNIDEGLRIDAEKKVGEAIGGNFFRQKIFNWVLSNARNRVRDRENLRFERTRLFGRVRRIFVEIGKRFRDQGMIETHRDIFSLEVEEIFGYIDGSKSEIDLKKLISERKTNFDEYRKTTSPPERFSTRGIVTDRSIFITESPDDVEEDLSGDTRKGIGCCPGIVRGVVKVIHDPTTTDFVHGSILVAERTDPGWIMLFPAASALLVERGSLLSHAAIVSREMGIPSIVSIPGVTKWLKDGETVEMNGATGMIRRISEVEEGSIE